MVRGVTDVDGMDRGAADDGMDRGAADMDGMVTSRGVADKLVCASIFSPISSVISS